MKAGNSNNKLFVDSFWQVVGFDGSTTVEEFLVTLNHEIGCRDVSQSGFALFSDDPIEKDEEHWLEPKTKVRKSNQIIHKVFPI